MVTLAIPDAIATPFSKRHGGTARGKKTAALNLVSLGTVADMLAAFTSSMSFNLFTHQPIQASTPLQMTHQFIEVKKKQEKGCFLSFLMTC